MSSRSDPRPQGEAVSDTTKLVCFLFGLLIGAGICVFGLTKMDNLVTIQGVKDKIQTVEWNGKNYRLVPLEKADKP